jgi:hypothetical protein
MFNSTQALAETVIPPLACERSSQAIECPEQPVTEEGDELFLPTPRRIIHAAIRFGKSFEFVVECCVL